jgi:hypothetical protein
MYVRVKMEVRGFVKVNQQVWLTDSSKVFKIWIGSKKLPDDGRILPKLAVACVLNKGMV